jgi:hypothetical protein
VSFVCEQDGPVERELKAKLISLFEHSPAVEIGYLVRVQYEKGLQHVALCLKQSGGSKEKISRDVGQEFAAMFNSKEHLDILFLS